VRLLQTLVKAAVILAIIAATLGGAVALGSTLFDSPPRDAADFAARIEAGSRHAPPPEERTATERRYVLAVGALCAERNERIRDLEREVSAADEIGRARGWRRIEAEYADEFEALEAPKRFSPTAERMTTLDRGMLVLTDEALDARRAGDRELFEAKLAAAELLDARYDEAAVALGAPVCTPA